MTCPPPLRIDLDGTALVENWRTVARLSGAPACAAAIKADGYGLGAAEVARRLTAAGCRDFFVATWGEALALGTLPGGASISVLHGVRAGDMAAARAGRARPVLNSADQVARWREAGGEACDVMVDTGMNRLGLTPEEACSGLLDGLAIETLMSHLACADSPGHPLIERQRARFVELRRAIAARRYSLANSAGAMLGADFAFDLVRPGLALYGGVPVADDPAQRVALRPVARLAAEVLQVRAVPAGESVGYGAEWVAGRPSRVAILNIGYADGLGRRIGPHLRLRSGDSDVRAIGRVSMDLLAVDVTNAATREGDWLSIDFDLPALAAATGLSQYELLTGLGRRLARRWADGG